MVKHGGVYIYVTDMDRSIQFYKAFLDLDACERFENRWAQLCDLDREITLGLFNVDYDKLMIEKGKAGDSMDQAYQDYVMQEIPTYGTNAVICFYTDNLENEYKRIKSLNPSYISEIMELNFMAPYRFFHFRDPDGNLFEIYHMD
jgi:catechol 2,3-dioxygenase-like lactoylglutathione lyase family enzyme